MASAAAHLTPDHVVQKLDMFLNAEKAPVYQVLPPEGHRTLEKAVDSIGDLVEKEHSVVIYNTNKRPKDKPDSQWSVGGSLQIGLKTHGAVEKVIGEKKVDHGIEKLYVRYRPFKGEWGDVSTQVQRVSEPASEQRFHIRKIAGITDFSAWSFDIFVTDIGRESSSFTGSIVINGVTSLWEGSADGVHQVKSKVERFTEPAPEGLKGSPQELIGISPLAWKAHDDLKYGEDAAQHYGDRAMQRMMWHALDDETRKTLLPNVPALSSLEQSIVKDNNEFLKRMATHVLAEEIKKMEGIPSQMKDSIPVKRDVFMRMMGAKDPPLAGSKDKDPVVEYGWSRNCKKHADLLKELQGQCQNVSLRCYEIGYLEAVPEWSEYIATPGYWYRYISWFVQTDGFLGPFTFNFVTETLPLEKDKEDKKERVQTPVGQDIYEIGNKLRLLLRYVPESERKDLLSIEQIMSKIELEGHLAIAQSRKFDLHLIQDLKLAMEHVERASADELKDSYKYVSDEVKNIQKDISAEGLEILLHLSKVDTPWWTKMKEWWNRKSPENVVGEGAAPSIGEVLEAKVIPTENLNAAPGNIDRAFENLEQAAEAPPGFGKKLAGWLKKKIAEPVGRVYTKVTDKIPFTIWTFLKFIGRAMLLGALVWQLAGGTKGYAQTGLLISLVAAETLSFGAWVTRGILLFFWADRGVSKAVAGWLTRSAVVNGGDGVLKSLGKVFFGDITKIVRLALLAGIVFSIINAYQELQRADEIDKYYRPAFKVYQIFQVSLGIFEGLLIALETLAEFKLWTRVASACGPLMMVACVIGIVLLIWWFCYTKDMALHPIKVFLQNKAKPLEAFNGELTV